MEVCEVEKCGEGVVDVKVCACFPSRYAPMI